MRKTIAFAALAATFFVTGSAFAAGGPMAHCNAVTRSAVLKDFEEWKNHPVASDGARWVGGEVGWSADATRATASSASSGVARNQGGVVQATGELQLVRGELGWVSAQSDLRIPQAAASITSPAVAQKRGYVSGGRLAFGELGFVPNPSTGRMQGRMMTGCMA